MTTIASLMTSSVATVDPSALVEDALDIMLEHHASGLPVVDGSGALVGLISEHDVLHLLLESDGEYWPVAPVVLFMSKDVISLDISASIQDAARLLIGSSIRRLPILEDGRLVGVLARRDLARAIRDQRRAAFSRVMPEQDIEVS